MHNSPDNDSGTPIRCDHVKVHLDPQGYSLVLTPIIMLPEGKVGVNLSIPSGPVRPPVPGHPGLYDFPLTQLSHFRPDGRSHWVNAYGECAMQDEVKFYCEAAEVRAGGVIQAFYKVHIQITGPQTQIAGAE